jgi:hypothetical protein
VLVEAAACVHDGEHSSEHSEENPVDLDLILLQGYYAFVCFIGCAFFYQRYRWRRNKRLGKRRFGFYPSGTSMGNALQQLQIIAEPQTKHVLEEKLDEDLDDEEAGGPDDPTRHLHRQAARIRRGERVDVLTTYLKK